MSQAVEKEIKEKEKETATNAADDAQVRRYILLLFNAAPPVGVNLRKSNTSDASAVTSLPPILPALHKILSQEIIN